MLVERLMDAGRVDDVDFFTCELDDLSLMQIYARIVAEQLPSTGRRSELQARLARHLSRGTASADSPNKTFLSKSALNVEGTRQDRAARRALFAGGKFSTAFEDMEFQVLKDVADMFGLQVGTSRQALLLSLKAIHVSDTGSKVELTCGVRGERNEFGYPLLAVGRSYYG